MKKHYLSIVRRVTGASGIEDIEVIQNLWSGYGQIVRFSLKGAAISSVVLKHVRLQEPGQHPRGWNSSLSHQRKLRSYQVETNWYQEYAWKCDAGCRVPECLAVEQADGEVLMILEDLDAAGFPIRKQSLNWQEMQACLSWLARFHATFMGESPRGLWETGTYWHLETRSEELAALSDIPLKKAAAFIDQKLKNSAFHTLVHGDAKLANFCFSAAGEKVAVVDFQYVGAGCGMKDLAYFIGSCLDEEQAEHLEAEILDFYFSELKSALSEKGSAIDRDRLEEDWRSLFYVAWADFHRFLKGWSPGHWKINTYSERISREVVRTLQKETGI